MPEAVNLGSIYAEVGLKLGQLTAGQAQVTRAVTSIGAELGKLDQVRVGQKMTAGLLPVGKALTGVAAGIAIAGTSAVKLAADFQASMTRISNNTTMTTSDIAKMKDAVTSLGKESGASFDDLAEGFAHITNFGYKAADATGILREAMRSAVATGTTTADTADILAKALHEFGLSAGEAGRAMNVMHLAAAQGNMTLQQFDEAAGPAMAEAANLGVSLTDVSAAMSALTRHGLDASEAATQVKDILVHMISPSKSAREELERLTKTTGIDLVGDFSQAGLKAKGFTGVLDDLTRATHGNGQEIYKLIQAQRGGLGAMILAGNGAQDYKDILGQLNEAMAGKIDPTTQAYGRSLKTLNNEIARVTNEIKSDFIPVGNKLIPVFEDATPLIRDTAKFLGLALDAFTKLPKPVQQTALAVGALSLAVKGLNVGLGVGGGAGLIGGLTRLAEKLGLTLTPGTLGGLLMRGGAALPVAGLAATLAKLNSDLAVSPGPSFAPVRGRAEAGAGAQIARNTFQAGLNRDAASRITASPEYAQVLAQIREFKGDGDAKNLAFAVQAKAKYDHDAAALLADAHRLSADAQRMRTGEVTGNNVVAEAMAKHIGQATGVECGAAVTQALRAAGLSGTASALARAAIADPKKRLRPDAAGDFPPGTVIFFPGKGGAVGRDPSEHFGVAGGVGPDGQNLLESTTAGGRGRHYRGDRTWQQVAAEHGGRYVAFSPGGAGGAGTGAGPGAAPPVDTGDLADLRRRTYEATHGEFENKRYDARAQFGEDKKIDPKLALETYRATLAQISKDEAAAHARDLAELKRHHKEVEAQWSAHAKRIRDLLAGKAAGAEAGVGAGGLGVSPADLGPTAQQRASSFKDAYQQGKIPFAQYLGDLVALRDAYRDTDAEYQALNRDIQAGFAAETARNVANRAAQGRADVSAAKRPKIAGDVALDAGDGPDASRPGGGRKGAGGFGWIGESMLQNVQVSIQHWTTFKSFWKSMVQEMKDVFLRAVAQMIERWAVMQLAGSAGGGLGGLFKGAAGGGAGGGGGLGSIAGLLGHGGGALGGLGKALPWVGAGLALNSLLGNPLKKLGKVFHFSGGGVVPGAGFRDTVPAMLTPGERVLTREQQRGMGGGHVININHYGDNHGAGDVTAMHSDWAWQIKQQLPVATPGT